MKNLRPLFNFKFYLTFSYHCRLANSGFGHSGTPFPPFSSLLLPPLGPTPPSFSLPSLLPVPRGPHP